MAGFRIKAPQRRPQGMRPADASSLKKKIQATAPEATLQDVLEAAAALVEERAAATQVAAALAEMMRGGQTPASWYLYALAASETQKHPAAAHSDNAARTIQSHRRSDGSRKSHRKPKRAGAKAFLARFEKRFVYVRDINRVYDLETGAILDLSALNNAYTSQMPVDPDSKKPLRPADVIVHSPNVRRVHQVTYAPGQPPFLREDQVGNFDTRYAVPKVNCWRASSVQPKPGDPRPVLDHITYIFDGKEELADTFLDYLAYVVQNPGERVKWVPLVIGSEGIGKDTISYVLARILGGHNCALEVDDDTLSGRFREWLLHTQLAVVPELLCGNNKQVMNKLKPLITGTTIRIDQKGISAFTIPNRTNFIFWSNYDESACLDPGDRRWFVYRSRAGKRGDDYYRWLYAWIDDGGDAIFAHHLHQRELSDFNPHAAPPMTLDKEEVIRHSRSEGEQVLFAMYEAGEAPLDRDILRLEDLEEILQERRLPAIRNTARRFLKSIGAVELGQKRVDPRNPTWKPRVWALRHVDLLAKAPESVIAELYQSASSIDRAELEELIARQKEESRRGAKQRGAAEASGYTVIDGGLAAGSQRR